MIKSFLVRDNTGKLTFLRDFLRLRGDLCCGCLKHLLISERSERESHNCGFAAFVFRFNGLAASDKRACLAFKSVAERQATTGKSHGF